MPIKLQKKNSAKKHMFLVQKTLILALVGPFHGKKNSTIFPLSCESGQYVFFFIQNKRHIDNIWIFAEKPQQTHPSQLPKQPALEIARICK